MSNDRRSWFRCKLPSGSNQAVLRVGRKDLPLILLNTSATGFSAQSALPIDAQTGDCLLMRTVTGWVEVRVARLETKNHATFLGLERLHEIGDDLPFNLLDFVGGRRGAVALVIALLGGAILGGAVVVVATYW